MSESETTMDATSVDTGTTKKSKVPFVIGFIFVVLVAVVGLVLARRVSVPDVTTLSKGAAIAKIKDAGLKVAYVTSIPNDEVNKGMVIWQSPTSVSKVFPGTEVQLGVSSGPVTHDVKVTIQSRGLPSMSGNCVTGMNTIDSAYHRSPLVLTDNAGNKVSTKIEFTSRDGYGHCFYSAKLKDIIVKNAPFTLTLGGRNISGPMKDDFNASKDRKFRIQKSALQAQDWNLWLNCMSWCFSEKDSDPYTW